MSPRKAIDCIKRNNNFLITTHTNMEGDALGSVLAFHRLLKALGKNASIITEDHIPYGYEFLPGINKIRSLKKKVWKTKFDALVLLDCSDLKRCGQVYKLNTKKCPLLNIDHHISNTRFADVNWIEPKAASCTQMVYRLYKELRLPLDKEIAMLLYIGILTDTGSFHYTNTNDLTHRITAELLSYGLDVAQIHRNIYENIPFEDIKLLSRILPTLARLDSGRIVWFQIKSEILRHHKIVFDLSEQILNFGRMIKDAEVVILFKENLKEKNEVRVNLRSHGDIDVNKIASYFGGGGHKTASGITMHGNIDRVTKIVLKKVRDSLK